MDPTGKFLWTRKPTWTKLELAATRGLAWISEEAYQKSNKTIDDLNQTIELLKVENRRASEVCDVSILSAEKSEKLADDQFCANSILQENVAKIKEEFSDFVSMSESQIEDLKKENSIKLET